MSSTIGARPHARRTATSTTSRWRRRASGLAALLLTGTGLALLPAGAAYANYPSFVCTNNTVYSVKLDNGQVYSVDSTTGSGSIRAEFGTGNWNALALGGAGSDIWAFERDDNKVKVARNTHTQQTYSVPSNSKSTSVVAGAINPANGIYYYASGGSTWHVFAFDTVSKTGLGQVATISGTGLGGNGDFAFDGSGNLYIVSNDTFSSGSGPAGTLARVNGSLPTTAGSTALGVTVLAETPAGNGQYHSMAFDSSGLLVIGTSSPKILRANPATGAIVDSSSMGYDFTDLASCAQPSTAQAQVNLPQGRHTAGDQFTVKISGGGLGTSNTGTTTGTDSGVQSDSAEKAGPAVVLPSQTYTITQTAAGSTSLSNYATSWTCKTASGTTVASGTGNSGTFTMPSSAGSEVTCTFTNLPQRPAIKLTKTASAINDVNGNGPDAGDKITYSFTVKNTGDIALNPVTVNDPLFGGSNPNITCPSGSLAPSATITCTSKTYTLTQADVNAGTIDNTATAKGTGTNGVQVSDTSSTGTPIAAFPAILLKKTAGAINDVDGNGPDAGDKIPYTFKVTNTGNVSLNPVTVHDPLFSGSNPNITCPPGALAPGASVTCSTATYTLTQANVDAGQVDNTGTATGTAPSGAKVTDSDTTSTPVARTATVDLVKTSSAIDDVDGNGADAGDKITFGFKVVNTGNVTLDPVKVHDPLFGGANPNITCPTGALAPAATVTCTSRTYTLTQVDVDSGKLENTATATGTKPGGGTVSDTSSTLNPIPAGPAIKLEKSASAIQDVDGNGADAGDTITYSFKVTNTGTVTLDPVTVHDPVFGGANPNITCPTGSLAPGASRTCSSRTYTLSQGEVDAGKIENTATATGTKPGGGTVSDTDSTSTAIVAGPAILLDKTVSAIDDVDGNGADAGDTVTYSFKVTNTGNVTLNPVTVHDPLLGGSSPNVTCPTGPLAPGASVTCTDATYAFTQADVDAGKRENTATATGTAPGGAKVTSSDSTTTTIAAVPAIQLTLTGSAIDDVDGNGHDAGDTITYTYKVKNTGTVALDPVTVHDPLLGGANPNVTCPAGSLAPGDTVTCSSRVYTLTQADVDAGVVDNTATTTGTAPSGAQVSDPDTVSTPVVGQPAIKLVKTASAINDVDGNGHDEGDKITFGFKVTNTGALTLDPVTVNDPLFANPAISCPAGALAPGASVTCSTKTYTLTVIDVDNGKVDNTATATGTTAGGATVTGSDSSSTPVVGAPSIKLVVTPSAIDDNDGNGHDAGDTITYTYEVTNTGGTTLDPVVVHDPLFPGAAPNVTCPAAPLAPGASVTCTSKTYTLTQADVDAGTVDTLATTTGTAPGGATVTDDDTTSTPVVPEAPSIELDLIASAIDDVDGNGHDAGDTITYTYVVINTGTQVLDPVVVHDPLLGGASPNVTCPAGPLAPGTSVTCTSEVYTLTQADVDAGVVNNTATATGTAPGGATVSDDDTTATPVVGERPSIELDLVASAIDDVDGNGHDAGDLITYTYVVTNTGTQVLDPVAVNDPLFANPTVICPAGPLAPGASVTCTSRTYTLTQADIDAGQVVNTATATGTAPGGATVTDDDSTTTPVVVEKADIKVTKTVDDNSPKVGDTVTYTITVQNKGGQTADSVKLTDVLPEGVTFVSAGSPCTESHETVTCEWSSLTAGASRTVTITATVDPVVTGGPDHDHQIDVQKAEVHMDLLPGQERALSVTCPTGYVVTDGSGRIDQVDQGTGTLASVGYVESRATNDTTWQATLRNDATGRAQAKVFAVCVKEVSEVNQAHAHDLQLGDVVTQSVDLSSGAATATLECAPGTVPIRPGYALNGTAEVVTSYPAGDNDWTFALSSGGGDATSGVVSIQCMLDELAEANGHGHDLNLREVTQNVTVPAGEVLEVTLTCPVGYKGIVAGWRLDEGLVNLGNDPRPIIRVFKLFNPTSGPLTADLWLGCLATRTKPGTGNPVVSNTASATTTSPEKTLGNNYGSATFTVDMAPASPSARVAVAGSKVKAPVVCKDDEGCGGVATLVALKTQKVAGKKITKGTVLAEGTYVLESGEKSKVVLKASKKGKKALKKVKKAKLTLGKKSKKVTLR
jgi:uncharacterized repeat protein (TIGR01451 family)